RALQRSDELLKLGKAAERGKALVGGGAFFQVLCSGLTRKSSGAQFQRLAQRDQRVALLSDQRLGRGEIIPRLRTFRRDLHQLLQDRFQFAALLQIGISLRHCEQKVRVGLRTVNQLVEHTKRRIRLTQAEISGSQLERGSAVARVLAELLLQLREFAGALRNLRLHRDGRLPPSLDLIGPRLEL